MINYNTCLICLLNIRVFIFEIFKQTLKNERKKYIKKIKRKNIKIEREKEKRIQIKIISLSPLFWIWFISLLVIV